MEGGHGVRQLLGKKRKTDDAYSSRCFLHGSYDMGWHFAEIYAAAELHRPTRTVDADCFWSLLRRAQCRKNIQEVKSMNMPVMA